VTQALVAGLVIADLNLLGASLVLVWRNPTERSLDGVLGFAAGGMLSVISDEIIPEAHARGCERVATFGTMLGVGVMPYLDVALAAEAAGRTPGGVRAGRGAGLFEAPLSACRGASDGGLTDPPGTARHLRCRPLATPVGRRVDLRLASLQGFPLSGARLNRITSGSLERTGTRREPGRGVPRLDRKGRRGGGQAVRVPAARTRRVRAAAVTRASRVRVHSWEATGRPPWGGPDVKVAVRRRSHPSRRR
jgi:hypothetical protein